MSPLRPPETYLAFDYGLRRTGVASGSRTLGRGSSLRTIAAEGQARFAPIEALIREWRPDALVVGVPRHPDGADHENTRRAQRFARQLQGRFGLPVFEVDERYSTTEVLAAGARDADAAAAALLLTQHLDELDRAARAATLARLQEQDPEETNPPKD